MSKKLWGGRFRKETDKDFFRFQKSIHYDYKLAEFDLCHSIVHVEALKSAGILNKKEARKLTGALVEILKTVRDKKMKTDPLAEDIHTDIQNKVEKKVGRLAHKLHTLRSRNDQIVFDEKSYCGVEAITIAGLLKQVLASLKFLGGQYKNYSIAGYTHLQRAQVLPFKDYLGSFVYMFVRDGERLIQFEKKLVVYIGSGALKGTILTKNYNKALDEVSKSYEISPVNVAAAINSPDNVSDRDFLVEFLSILSIIQMHLSRLAEDFILYSTKEFNYFNLPEEFCTGSSLMPHKKNPDFLELLRGYSGRIYGNLFSLLTTMKGLPLAYNRDMQLDKEPLFSSVDTIKDELKILARFIKRIRLNKEAIEKVLEDESLYATEIAQYLVMKKVPFAQAHKLVGRLIRYSEEHNCRIKNMPQELLKKFSAHLNREAIRKVFGRE